MVSRLAILLLVWAIVLSAPGNASAGSNDEPAGYLIALDARTGKERWRSDAPGYFAIEDVSPRRIFGRGFTCSVTDFRSVAYDARTGARRWQGPAGEDRAGSTGGNRLEAGSRRSGIVVVQRGDDRHVREVQGRDAKTGVIRWRERVKGDARVVVNATEVFIADAFGGREPSSTFTALERASGDELYRLVLDPKTTIHAVPADRGAALMQSDFLDPGDVDAQLLDRSGQVRWQVENEIVQSIGSSVVALEYAGPALAIRGRHLDNGALLWEREGAGYAAWAAGDRFGIVDNDGVFTMVDARTGTAQWSRSSSLVRNPLVMGMDTVVFAEGRHSIAAVDAVTGVTRWRAALPEVGDAPISAGLGSGTVYVTAGCTPSD